MGISAGVHIVDVDKFIHDVAQRLTCRAASGGVRYTRRKTVTAVLTVEAEGTQFMQFMPTIQSERSARWSVVGSVRYLGGVLAAAALLLSSDAYAAIGDRFGVCAGGAITTNPGGAHSWQQIDECRTLAAGGLAWNANNWAWGAISIPVKTATGLTAGVWAVSGLYGGDGTSSSRPEACAQASTWDSAGNFSAAGNQYCTNGTKHHQMVGTLLSDVLGVPNGGALVVNYGAQKGAGVDVVYHQYNNN
jgi:hypothetical protein